MSLLSSSREELLLHLPTGLVKTSDFNAIRDWAGAASVRAGLFPVDF